MVPTLGHRDPGRATRLSVTTSLLEDRADALIVRCPPSTDPGNRRPLRSKGVKAGRYNGYGPVEFHARRESRDMDGDPGCDRGCRPAVGIALVDSSILPRGQHVSRSAGAVLAG